jgi:transcriptional regulator with XRE-family HTH domain
MDDLSRQVGVNLRRLRRAQGLSLDVVAGRSGLSKSFLSRVENGERSLERRTHLSAVSDALGCSIADLVGISEPTAIHAPNPVQAQAMPAMRRILNGLAIGHLEQATAPPIEDLRARAQALWSARLVVDIDQVWTVMPSLIRDLHAHTVHGPDRRPALGLLVETTSAAAFALRASGYTDLAWTAAERCHDAALELADPGAAGLAEFTRAHAATFGHGYAGSLLLAERAADALRPQLDGDEDRTRVYGSLLLTASWAAGIAGRHERVDPYLSEALDLSGRLADPDPVTERYQTMFGPSNSVIWQMSIAVEAGDGGRAAELARTIDPAVVGSKSREAAYWTELGCGLSQERATEAPAVRALLTAERIAPARTRSNGRVRAVVARMLDDAHQRGTAVDLSRLAHRVGVTGG